MCFEALWLINLAVSDSSQLQLLRWSLKAQVKEMLSTCYTIWENNEAMNKIVLTYWKRCRWNKHDFPNMLEWISFTFLSCVDGSQVDFNLTSCSHELVLSPSRSEALRDGEKATTRLNLDSLRTKDLPWKGSLCISLSVFTPRYAYSLDRSDGLRDDPHQGCQMDRDRTNPEQSLHWKATYFWVEYNCYEQHPWYEPATIFIHRKIT